MCEASEFFYIFYFGGKDSRKNMNLTWVLDIDFTSSPKPISHLPLTREKTRFLIFAFSALLFLFVPLHLLLLQRCNAQCNKVARVSNSGKF